MGTVPAWLLRPIPGAIFLIPARDTGSVHEVYRRDDTRAWRTPALVFGVFFAVILAGILWSQPWNWRKWIRRRREIGRHRR